MLHLQYLTPPEWADVALSDKNRLLLDHKFCEGKAAAMARAFIKRYGKQFPKLVPLMKALAEEEDEHRDLCQQILDERGAPPMRHHGNPYVNELRRRVHESPGGGTVLDQLLIAGTVEARSCERFRLLADACRGGSFGHFYEDLFASEARHHTLFVNLAVDHFGEDVAMKRLQEVTAIEAKIVIARPWGAHIH
ncbi:MAG: tRNA isopentenyl-2-thiomethyl-A-37 hydroxylase MiaE [Planctomycetota bacterium]